MIDGFRQSALRRLAVLRTPDQTIFRFAVVGFATTIVDLALFSALVFATDLSPVAANIISYSTGVCISFILNRRWTFAATSRHGGGRRQAFRFAVTNLVGVAISTLVVGMLATIAPELLAKAVSLPTVFVWNYLSSRYWAFRAE